MQWIRLLTRGLVVFWALWSTLVFGSNLADALAGLRLLPEDFVFASGNATSVVEVTAVFGTPAALAALLFGLVLVWDAVNATLFWLAVRDEGSTDRAFVVSLGLWATFMVADEMFLAYRVGAFEQTHRGIFVALLASLLAVKLLPLASPTAEGS